MIDNSVMMRMKVFLSTMWDLYFFWRFDCKENRTAYEFEEEVKKHLSFMFNSGETMPDLRDAILELYTRHMFYIENYYHSQEKIDFVDRYYDKLQK